MPSDQRTAKYANTEAGLRHGELTQIIVKETVSGTTRLAGEAIGSYAVSGLSAGAYSDDVAITFYGNPAPAPVWKVINQAWGVNDALLIPQYIDQDDNTNTWSVPGTVLEDCEDDWVGTGFTTAGDAGVAGVTNAVVGTNAVNLDIDGTSSATEFIFEATGTLDLSTATYLSLWLTTNVALTAGDFAIGISTSTTYATGITEVNIPAQAAGTTKNHIIAITGIAAVESVGLTMKVDPGNGAIQIDDVRWMTTAERDLYTKNLIVAGTAQNTFQSGGIDAADKSLKNVLDISNYGGASGDDIEIRAM